MVAHDPLRADDQKQARDKQIQELIFQGEQWAGKLDSQDLGQKHKGRKLSDAGATARFYQAVAEARRIQNHSSRLKSQNLYLHHERSSIDAGGENGR